MKNFQSQTVRLLSGVKDKYTAGDYIIMMCQEKKMHQRFVEKIARTMADELFIDPIINGYLDDEERF
jgi:chorismate synthase